MARGAQAEAVSIRNTINKDRVPRTPMVITGVITFTDSGLIFAMYPEM